MREIKFRGRSIEDNKTWFYGHYYIEYGIMPNPIRTPKSEPIGHDDTHWIVFPGFADWNMPREMQRVQIEPETRGEYTGLKDKNGAEIYEGDIIECEYYPNLPTTRGIDLIWRGEVIWGMDASFHIFRHGVDHSNYYAIGYSGEAIKRKEVIGNIYENQELLGGE